MPILTQVHKTTNVFPLLGRKRFYSMKPHGSRGGRAGLSYESGRSMSRFAVLTYPLYIPWKTALDCIDWSLLHRYARLLGKRGSPLNAVPTKRALEAV
jgi:hypothetical protein